MQTSNTESQQATFEIAVGIDDAFTVPLMVLAYSGLPASSELNWNVFYFPEKLERRSIDLISAVFSFFEIKHSFHEIYEEDIFDSRRYLSSSTFLKFGAFEKLGPNTLWLDGDLLLLNRWNELKTHVDKKFPLQAIDQPKGGNQRFNAGLMMLNQPLSENWRSEIKSAPKERYSSDQVIFNNLYSEIYGSLPMAFNTLWGNLVTLSTPLRPRIIHYGGANKPWHLPDRFISTCLRDDCVWKPYLMTQQSFLESLPKELSFEIVNRLREVRRKRPTYYKREALGRQLSYLLEVSGALSWILVGLLRVFRSRLPAQALHPVHGKKRMWNWKARKDQGEGVRDG